MDKVIVRMLLGGLAVVGALIVFVPINPLPDFLTDRTLLRSANAASAPVSGALQASRRYRLTFWRELAPPNWVAKPPFRSEDIARLGDTDPRAKALLADMRSAWSAAPPNPLLDGVAIRTAGFVVPIEQGRDGTREFLLVPYYGACIHTPPPPANQIIDVSTSTPVKGLDAMDTVWVAGVLNVTHTGHNSGSSTYAMRADDVEPYTEPPR
ncbi:MAG: DUF3299 domain-containing protein [Pseudomonadota bacterium]|nr:DUF3299 domain-containing protein [Pseudomonadota bacterium]